MTANPDALANWARLAACKLLGVVASTDLSPTDLDAAMAANRVKRVTDSAIERDGMLIPRGDGFEIRIKWAESRAATRRRWTLAHELAHTLFFDVGAGTPHEDGPPTCPLTLTRSALATL